MNWEGGFLVCGWSSPSFDIVISREKWALLRIVQRPSDLEKAICSMVSIRNEPPQADLLIVGNHRNRKLQSVCPIGKEDPETLERGDKKKIRRGGGRAAEGRGGGQFNKG
ncbi:hypothetical protein D5086_007193 [Populus alba]|uniref:Uncharacterized protein n=1 Tax=Populus alba TaxID=43335 RepID=A0ACC4CN38_POPAL